ncbi:MAG: sigma-70 family RNA polymerase sigma factor [Lentisphaerae bacterium]|nr:sigma-70 family RNA polymerase sigma factor [Lentisphaerota bacterium]
MAFSTNKSLLSKISVGDEIGWEEFYRNYAPLIWLRGGDLNLSKGEKQDLIQDVMLCMFTNAGKFKYDREKGRFRDYMRTIIDRRAVDIIRRRDPAISVGEDILRMNDKLVSPEQDDRWLAEWKTHVLNQALVELKSALEPITYQIFELYALKGWTPARVQRFLKVGKSSVYTAKSRAVDKLGEIIKKLESEQ